VTAVLLLVLALSCLAVAVYLVGEVATTSARQRLALRRRAVSYGRRPSVLGPREAPFGERVLNPAKDRLAALVLRASPRTTVDAVADKLLAAGLGRRLTVKGFLAMKGGFALGGLVFGILVGASSGLGRALLPALALGALGFVGPDFVVSSRARRRREEIRAELPDALDILSVSVEAGLGFDGAIAKVTEHMDGPLSEELALTLNEMRIGESRQDALKKLAERSATPEVGAFTRAIIQADQLGISLGRILRVQAADTRLRRQAAAEEKAMKTPIKMLFPTVAFIFPAMFLVILGPAFLNLVKVL
jgi:tight adherence protein C